jgi:hypothetical protein
MDLATEYRLVGQWGMGRRENWAELEREILVPYPSVSVCRPCNSRVRDIIPEQWRGGYQNMISVRIYFSRIGVSTKLEIRYLEGGNTRSGTVLQDQLQFEPIQ